MECVEFNEIRRTHGYIIGVTDDDEVAIRNENWEKVEQWQNILRDLLQSAAGVENNLTRGEKDLQISREDAVETLCAKGYVTHTYSSS